jgi:hypothetical protein
VQLYEKTNNDKMIPDVRHSRVYLLKALFGLAVPGLESSLFRTDRSEPILNWVGPGSIVRLHPVCCKNRSLRAIPLQQRARTKPLLLPSGSKPLACETKGRCGSAKQLSSPPPSSFPSACLLLSDIIFLSFLISVSSS